MNVIFAVLGTAGCCIVFHVPKKIIIPVSLTGGIGWFVYESIMEVSGSYIAGAFFAAVVIALIADIMSRLMQEAATVFVIPGIIPLVPGAAMYYAMLDIIRGNLDSAVNWGTRAFLVAGSIAVGLLVMSSIIRLVVHVVRRIRNRKGTT